MDKYYIQKTVVESLVLHPRYLGFDINESLKKCLELKYSKHLFRVSRGCNETEYIFNIRNVHILDNIISPLSQCKIEAKFTADFYLPKVGHTFLGILRKSKSGEKCWIDLKPIVIYVENNHSHFSEGQHANVVITKVKYDNTVCFGQLHSGDVSSQRRTGGRTEILEYR
jgi:hypothetical protein